MSTHPVVIKVYFIFIIIAVGAKVSQCARNFTIVNACNEKVWPGISAGNGSNTDGGGFALQPGQSMVYTAPPGWNGRIWGRTGCSFDKNGSGTCLTGSCGNSLNCTAPGSPPSSIAEFTLGSPDYYDISLVDGFNLPVAVTPVNGTGNCTNAGCDRDLRLSCPSELAMRINGKTTACKSACNVFGKDEYCCRGMYGNPMECQPSNYSKIFKEACPKAYSYAFDDPTSILTCSNPDYIVTFCATRNQTVCLDDAKKMHCKGSKASEAPSQRWRVMMVVFPLMILSCQVMIY